jgi:urease accessory protein
VHDTATAKNFTIEMLSRNIFYTDAAFVSLAFDAVVEENEAAILELDEECTAVKLPMEIRQASQKLGNRLIKIFGPLCESEMAGKYSRAIRLQQAVGHYSIVFGMYAAAMRIDKKEALTGFYYNAAAGLVTNCVKLIPLGQLDGQELLFSLHALVQQLVAGSMKPDRDLTGLCCSGFDIASMQHETLYSRLYMS